jgi:endonuclease/exonuclease/phosphatase family metal-dependent hydrolase
MLRIAKYLRRCLFFTFLALNVVLVFVPATALSTSLTPASGLKVMSYNIQQMGYPSLITLHFEQERLAELPLAILAMEEKPDVIIFQESFLPSARAHIIEQLAELYPYASEIGGEHCSLSVWSSPPKNCEDNLKKSLTHNSGVFILSRWPVLESHSITYNSVRVSYTFDFMARKGAVYSVINKEGQRFHVVGTHLQADAASHDIRMSQIGELMAWLEDFSIPVEEALLFAGDFNVSSLKQNELGDLLQKTGTHLSLPDQGLGSVSPESNEYLSLIYGGETEKTLDYVLLSKKHRQPLNLTSLQTLNFKAKQAWQGKTLFQSIYKLKDISDHYPVILNLNFDKRSD